jgi:quinol monooxygenase YgiN
VTYRAKAGLADELAEALAAYATIVRSEPGCLTFAAARSSTDPDVFHLYEEYRSTDAFKAHKASSHYATFVTSEFLPRLAERTVTLATPVGD